MCYRVHDLDRPREKTAQQHTPTTLSLRPRLDERWAALVEREANAYLEEDLPKFAMNDGSGYDTFDGPVQGQQVALVFFTGPGPETWAKKLVEDAIEELLQKLVKEVATVYEGGKVSQPASNRSRRIKMSDEQASERSGRSSSTLPGHYGQRAMELRVPGFHATVAAPGVSASGSSSTSGLSSN